MRDRGRSTPWPRRVLAVALTGLTGAGFVVAPVAVAAPSKLPPEVGYDHGFIETPRSGAMGGALRAFSNSTEALFTNPANMAATRVYHLGALAQIWPEASRQTYGVAVVDSIVSASRLAGGLGGTWTRQDPDGVDRTAFDLRFALAFPFSESFFMGGSARYLSLKQAGSPRGQFDLLPSEASRGLAGQPIVKNITFDAGMTFKPAPELALSLVGYNLTDPGHGFLPLMLGGGIGYGTQEFTVEADALADFTTYESSRARAMVGGEVLVSDHFPLRAGYRFDEGATSHTLSAGFGYIDRAYSLDLSLERVVSGDPATVILLGFKYHVESSGMTPEGEL